MRPWHEQIAYQRITDDLLLGWNRGGADLVNEISVIPGHRVFFVHPISVGFKAEEKGSSISCRTGLTAVDQAGVMLEERSATAASGVSRLPDGGCDFPEGVTMSMSRTLSRFAVGFLLPALLLLAACGGGGGGGGGGSSPVVYSGNTSAATVTPNNASKLTANVIGSEDTATTIFGVSVESSGATQNQSSGLMDLALRLNRNFRDTVVRAEQASSNQRALPAAIPVDETDLCDGGNGSIRTFGTLNDNGTGTLMLSFISCLLDGITLNGPATLRVDAVSFLPQPIPTDFTISFIRLTLRGSGLSIDAGGSLRGQLIIFPETETITANLVSLNNNTGQMTKTENLVIVNVITSATSFTANISGRVFDQVHGYVDITTPTLLVFGTLNQLFPDSGQLLLTGTNSSIRVMALSATLTTLALDLDGNGVPESTATLKWTDLSGPVGADLRDFDGDLMHNSWETVNGLDPLDATDAVLDKDGDLTSNLNEYLAGTDPSIP